MKLLSFASPNITNAACVWERETVHMHTHTFKAKFTELNRQLVKQRWLQQEAQAHLIRVLMMELRCLPFSPPFCHSANQNQFSIWALSLLTGPHPDVHHQPEIMHQRKTNVAKTYQMFTHINPLASTHTLQSVLFSCYFFSPIKYALTNVLWCWTVKGWHSGRHAGSYTHLGRGPSLAISQYMIAFRGRNSF